MGSTADVTVYLCRLDLQAACECCSARLQEAPDSFPATENLLRAERFESQVLAEDPSGVEPLAAAGATWRPAGDIGARCTRTPATSRDRATAAMTRAQALLALALAACLWAPGAAWWGLGAGRSQCWTPASRLRAGLYRQQTGRRHRDRHSMGQLRTCREAALRRAAPRPYSSAALGKWNGATHGRRGQPHHNALEWAARTLPRAQICSQRRCSIAAQKCGGADPP